MSKPYYIAGELVQATVLITTSGVQARELVVKWKGYERTKIKYQDVETIECSDDFGNPDTVFENVSKTAKEEIMFFEQELAVFHPAFQQGYLPPGTYEFPIQFQLPQHLPGSFAIHRQHDLTAAIVYKVKAKLVSNHELKVSAPLLIAEYCIHTPQPITISNEKGFLLARGKLRMRVDLEKNIFATQEQIPVKVHVENGSSKNVAAIKIKLMQDLKVKAKHMHKNELLELRREVFPGVAPKQTFEQVLVFNLPSEVFPSTSGSLIHNKYHLDIECDVKFAIDLEVHPAITLVMMPANYNHALIFYQAIDWQDYPRN